MYEALLRRMADDVRAGGPCLAALPAYVQTNEVERSRALLPGFLEVVRQTGLPLRLLEIGASAGLNLRWDHFPFLDVPATIRVAERRGCDLNPIDPTLDESRAAILCFVWPDQTERLQVLAEVIEIARRVPAAVDRCDAVDWLRIHLADPRPSVATIVYHSVVMPYLTEENRENLRRVAEVHLTMWPGGERRLIAQAGFHGRDVKVL